MTRSVFIETFGCQMNTADSEQMLGRLGQAGWTPVETPEEADLVVFNTCSVRDHAEGKIRSRLGVLREQKKQRPALKIAIAGCMAQREKDEILRKWPQVDIVVGTDQFARLPELVERVEETGRICATDFGDWEDDRGVHALRTEGVNAWVPVMRGCNYNCTYCVVPFTRGREKSRRPEAVEDEVRSLVAKGFRQVTLLGQTVDAYGKTLGDGSNLACLLRRLHGIEGLLRIRFITSHPKDITDELLDTVAALPKVAKHLHVPAQAGSDRILRLMGRRYGRDEYLRFVERARARMPEVELLSDFIVGFPGETDAEFEETVALMRQVRFGGAYVFTYSVRPGTPAVRLPDDVPEAVKKERCNRLLALQLEHQEEDHRRLHGREVEILVEGASKTDADMLHGRTIGNRNVVFPRQGRDGMVGTLQRVRVTRSTALTLFAD
ncbi:MAG: tRNA (N6-isopentenyl adenosine(37)-C2)-methylthiotransferase MiaB [Planctomycetes bacterium]|nr:tRNA (N6-isopentenyl adenosine(37)-C2)-methylthiotransferase MiaB [Planctomycetota bacterium]